MSAHTFGQGLERVLAAAAGGQLGVHAAELEVAVESRGQSRRVEYHTALTHLLSSQCLTFAACSGSANSTYAILRRQPWQTIQQGGRAGRRAGELY